MPLTLNAIADIVTATLFDEKDKRLSDISPDRLVNYVFCRRLLAPNAQTEQGGKAIRFDLNVAYGAEAQWVAPYQVMQVAVSDSIKQGQDEMRYISHSFGMDQMEECWNQGKYAIIEVIKNREQNCRIKVAEKIEKQAWGETAFANRDLQMNGLLNLLPYCATTGFVGTVASGYTTCENVDPTVYTGWKSYGGVYADVSKTDLLAKLKTGWTQTHFEAPLDTMLIPDYKMGDKFGLYMNQATRDKFDNQLLLNNDSLGDDVVWEHERAKFKGIPLTYVAALDANLRNVVFGINWGYLWLFKQKGWWYYPIIQQGSQQPTVVNTFLYSGLQLVTPDRRQLGFNFALAA